MKLFLEYQDYFELLYYISCDLTCEFSMFQTTPNSPRHPLVTLLKRVVVLLSMSYAFLSALAFDGTLSFYPGTIFDWSSTSFFSYITKTWILSCIIPYPAFSWTMVWDFLFLSLFFVPIVSFVLSYCGSRSFIYMWLLYAYVAGASMMIFSRLFPNPAFPFSIFLNIAYGILIFWILMLTTSKSRPSAFFIIPISTEWILILSTLICVFVPATQQGLATSCTSLITGFSAYLYAITKWRMTSGIPQLQIFEEKTKEAYYNLETLLQWHIMRNLRAFSKWLSQLKK